MLLRLLFRRETIVLGGVAAAFVVPMFRSGELSVGKIAHWVANGIASSDSESAGPANRRFDDFGTWPAVATQAPGENPGFRSELGKLSQPQPGTDGSAKTGVLARFLNSIFETQTLIDSPDPSAIGIPQSAGPFDDRPPLTPGGTPPTTTIPNPKNANENSPATLDRLSPWIPVNDLREIIRFDVSPYWVQQRWQPATRLDLDQDGYYGFRVPLISDQRIGNLTGALTFYFDAKAVVQRIQFQGTVQDTTPVEGLLRQYFHFEPVPDRPSLWAPVHRGTARGMLRFSDPLPAGVNSAQPLREIVFEVNSTQGNYKLSEVYRQIAVQ